MMSKNTAALAVVLLGLVPTVFGPMVLRLNNSDLIFGLSSDFWGGFVMSAAVGCMLVLLASLKSLR